MKRTSPLVAISVVNWNTPEDTLVCLESLRSQRYRAFRIVVVDNASRDDSVEQIRREFPKVEIVRSAENLGYAGGHELALRRARDWGAAAIWLVNSDAQAADDALQRLVSAWRAEGDAVYGGLPLRRRGSTRLMVDFPTKYLDVDGVSKALRRDPRVNLDYDAWCDRAPLRVGAVVGSSLFVPLTVVQAYGWLDPAWFLYCEEIDYCYRLRACGVPSVLVPQSTLYHESGGSHRGRRRVERRVQYYRARNEIVLARRHAGAAAAFVAAAKKLLRGIAAGCVDPARGWMILRGARDGLTGRLGKTVAPEDFLDAPAEPGAMPTEAD